jgi:hypothetical protein
MSCIKRQRIEMPLLMDYAGAELTNSENYER